MTSASPLEIAWTAWGLIGWAMALIVLGGATTLLIGRYQDNRNGAVRMLAWQFVIVSILCAVGLLAILIVGFVALALPARTVDLQPGWETAVAEAAAWLSPLCLFVIASCFVGIAATKLAVGLRLRRYYRADRHRKEGDAT